MIIVIINRTHTKSAKGFILRTRFSEITRCTRRVHATARCRQTVENLITSNNKNGYLDAVLSRESYDDGDNGRTNVRRLRTNSDYYYSQRAHRGGGLKRLSHNRKRHGDGDMSLSLLFYNINNTVTVPLRHGRRYIKSTRLMENSDRVWMLRWEHDTRREFNSEFNRRFLTTMVMRRSRRTGLR